MGGSAIGGGLAVSDRVYWLQLLVDGYPDRARLLAASATWTGDPETREIASLLVQLIDQREDEIEAQVEEARDDFVPDWSDCPNCEDHEHEVETLRTELDDTRDELEEVRRENKKGHCPACLRHDVQGEDKCPGGLAAE